MRSADYDFLYALLGLPEAAFWMRSRGATLSPEEFRSSLWSGTFLQFFVETSPQGRPCGLASIYNANHKNGVGYLGLVGHPAAMKSGDLVRGAALLIDYTFQNWPFRKLYFESAQPNFDRMASGLGTIFAVEGRLVDYEYLAGEYVDVFVCAIGRDDWIARRDSAAQAAKRYGDTISLDEFTQLVAVVFDFDYQDILLLPEPDVIFTTDSLQAVEVAVLIEELTGVSVTATDITTCSTLREYFLLYCQKASMPRE